MAKAQGICKICGCVYDYCRTNRTDHSVFRYEDVCCCPEHGAEYLAKVMKARGMSVEQKEDDKPVDQSEKTDEEILSNDSDTSSQSKYKYFGKRSRRK